MQAGVCWGLEGCPKAGSASKMLSLHCCIYVLEPPVQNLRLLKFQLITFSQFLFRILRLHMKYTKKFAPFKNFPLYGIFEEARGYGMLVWGQGARIIQGSPLQTSPQKSPRKIL